MRICCVIVLAAEAYSLNIAAVTSLFARDGNASWHNCSAVPCVAISETSRSLSKNITVADDYCHTRCDQRYEYCLYRGESRDHCMHRLAVCKSQC